MSKQPYSISMIANTVATSVTVTSNAKLLERLKYQIFQMILLQKNVPRSKDSTLTQNSTIKCKNVNVRERLARFCSE